MPAPGDARRLTFDDALFDTMGRVLDTPVVTQTVWRFAEPLAAERVQRFHAGLARGPLQRRIARTPIPAARDRWAPHSVVAPVRQGRPISPGGLMDWLAGEAGHAATALDADAGPVWSLAYAPLDDGGSVLSFATLHVVADGGLKLLALEAAADGGIVRDEMAGSWGTRPAISSRTILAADLHDAARQAGTAARAVPRVIRGLRPPTGTAPAATPALEPRPDDDDLWTPPVVVLDIPLADWLRAADAEGGTPNALMLGLCAELAASLGRADAGTISIASPVSTRTAGDLRSNASTGVSIPVTLDGGGRASLAEVRASARTAYAALAHRHPEDDPLTVARALLPLLPDALLRRLAPGWRRPAVLASNLGTLSDAVVAPTGTAATSVLNRSITPPTTRGAARRTGSCLSAWWGATGTTATFCLAGGDPDASPDAAMLARHVAEVLARRGLAASSW